MGARSLWVASMLAIVLAMSGCGQSDSGHDQASESQDEQAANLIFGTGGTSGVYYPIGGALKNVFENSDKVDYVQVVSTGASVQNIHNIEDGTNNIAIVMSDVAYDAIHGKKQFEDHPVKIDALAGMYQNVVQIVALDGSDIGSVADLKNKRVGVGKVGSGVEASAKKVLKAAGLTYDDLAKVSHTGYADSVTNMKNGNLDAAFFTSGVPNSSITGLMQNANVHFAKISDDTTDSLLDKYPYFERHQIEAGVEDKYDLDSSVHTVGIRNLLVVPKSMDKGLAKALTKRFYNYLGSDNVSVSALKDFDRDTMAEDLVVPVHPGSKKFYKSNASDN
ncbi:TAXI family TRAP transporter solute-binding subunit [Salinisphaera sp. USBA-960]|nr:TAXI family TRAP transporter solute-binding subunit [Salifodinibacter halophilus]NNC26280.1 TAXI family TRAP transporter solute-binding subunit [Salifodinibacter halophilus]